MLDMPLSKSALQLGAQCQRMLWLKYNRPYRADIYGAEAAEQEQFRIGNVVGKAAQGYFGEEGTVIIDTDAGFSPEHYADYAAQTDAAMADPDVHTIAEATFYTGDLVVFVDILHRNPDGGWDIYEVKAAGYIGPVHVRDAAWQTYVARELCGVEIVDTYLMHPNADWHQIEKHGECVPEDFEIVDDFTNFIYDYSTGKIGSTEKNWMEGMTIGETIDHLVDMVTWKKPPVCEVEPDKGFCCSSPYPCNWTGACKQMLAKEEKREEMENRDWRDYTDAELEDLAESYRMDLQEDGSRWVCQASENTEEYVHYMVKRAIFDGVPQEEAETALDSRLWDLGDFEQAYGFGNDPEDCC